MRVTPKSENDRTAARSLRRLRQNAVPMAVRLPSDAEKPVVGVVFSETDTESNESRYLAAYLAGVLVQSGFAKAALLGYRADGRPSDLARERRTFWGTQLQVLPPGRLGRSARDVVSVPVAAVDTVAAMASDGGVRAQLAVVHWGELANCDVLLVTVNAHESEACAAKMAFALDRLGAHEVAPWPSCRSRGHCSDVSLWMCVSRFT